MSNPRLVAIDLSKGDGHQHPDITAVGQYLALIGGSYHCGRFVRVWFGWSFDCGFGASGSIQFDAPGSNASRWQGLWRIEDDAAVA